LRQRRFVYYITFDRLPPTDRYGRPLFAYGKAIHDNCERRAHYDAGQYVEEWGDQGHRTGYCLYKMGCKGPVAFQNCPNIRWNEGTNWPIGCGHPCIGCAEPNFWDEMTPFYQHLSGFPGFGMHSNIDKVGFWGTLGVGAAFATHGLVKLGQRVMQDESPAPTGDDKAGGAS
jgi:hydrogenase small subunit